MKRSLTRERLDVPLRVRLKPQLKQFTLLDAMNDPAVFGPFFKDPQSWIAWRAFIAAAFGLPMSAEEFAIYQACTSRTTAPTQQMREAVLVVGRRGGKSRALALVAVWLACFCDYRQHLDAGELGLVQVLAADKEQAKTILRYAKAFVKRVPMLRRLVERETNYGLELSNSIAIEIVTASFRTVRGRTVVACLADEVAFWHSEESANPDVEVINAIRPGMATIPNAMLLLASSPYARKGVLYTQHKKYHGKDDPRVLSWQASTQQMNPSIDPEFIKEAFEADPVSASAEYGAQFRSDIEAFLTREVVETVTSEERERPYVAGNSYSAFVDPSGGSGTDSFTLAIAHVEQKIGILDVIREVKPNFSPRDVVEQYSVLLKQYGITKIVGDRYAGEWPREQFQQFGMTYEPSARPKSQIYAEFLPMLMSKRIDLLDNDRLMNQLIGLERRVSRGGKDSIDHSPGGHDDISNAVAGVLTMMGTKKYRYDGSLSWVSSSSDVVQEQSVSAQRLSNLLNLRGIR